MSHISIDARAFTKAIDLGRLVTERRNTIPVLSTAYLSSGPAGASIAFTNIDMHLDISLDVIGDLAPGDALLGELDSLRAAVRAARAESVDVAFLPDHKYSVATGPLSVAFESAIPPEDWPAARPVGEPIFSAVFGESEIAAIRRVFSAVSREETRYYLNGVFLAPGAGPWSVRAVATDGHRMHIAELSSPELSGALPSGGIIIPRETLSVLFRVIAAVKGEPVTMRVLPRVAGNSEGLDAPTGDHAVDFTVGKARLRSALIDGTFPAYEKVIPKEFPHFAKFDKAALRRGLEAVLAGASTRSSPGVEITFLEGAVRLSRKWACGLATATITVDAEHNLKLDAALGLNARYLLAAIDALGPHESVTMQLVDSGEVVPGDKYRAPFSSPVGVVTPDDGAFRTIVMPMRV